MKIPIAILFAGLLAACNTHPISASRAVPAPAHRIYNSEILTPRDGAGQVIVTRDTGALGSACSIGILADGVSVAALNPGEKIEMYLPPGDHIIAGITRGGLCGSAVVEAAAAVTTALPLAFRVGVSGAIFIYPTMP